MPGGEDAAFRPHPRPVRGTRSRRFVSAGVGLHLIALWVALLVGGTLHLGAQPVFESADASVYAFLEEMSAEGFIGPLGFAKPLSRHQIADALDSLSHRAPELNPRQRAAFNFHLRDYGKELHVGKDWERRLDLFYHSDSIFQITVNPILGGTVTANQNGRRIHTRIGAEFHGTIRGLGFYGSLQDNGVSEAWALPPYLTPRPGQNYKTIVSADRNDYNEAVGGVGYGWSWGDVSLVKDRYRWGSAPRNPNVFSGKAPSYAAVQLRLHPVKWLDFQYMHGWLVSEVLDSSRTYLTPHGNRRVQTNKNIAANFVTIHTNWKVDLTAGNSIVYSDDGVQPVYFIPFLFYKSADHTYSGTGSNELGQNSQMFFDVAVRSLAGFRFFATLFVDEVSLSNFWDADQHTNIMSFQVGATAYNVVPNIHVTGQYTRTAPWTYRHQIPSTTFASNGYNLGHYLGENADEVYGRVTWTPKANLRVQASVSYARKGEPHRYEIVAGNANVTGLEFMESTVWQRTELGLEGAWEPLNGAVIFGRLSYSQTEGDSRYTAPLMAGDVLTGEVGFRVGW